MKSALRLLLGTYVRTMFLALGLLLPATKMGAQETLKPVWTASLQPYGYRHNWGPSRKFTRVDGLAATKDTIAVALGDHDYRDGKRFSSLRLILLETRTGKFLSKLGPWESDPPYRLTSTQEGRFLLFLSEGELHLFSSSGEELKEVNLEVPSVSPGRLWYTRLFVSPSNQTILIASTEFHSGEAHHRIYSADTLELKMDWTEAGKKGTRTPSIVGISDEQMLGSEGNSGRHFLRDFKGPWQDLSLPHGEVGRDRHLILSRSEPAFLKDALIVSSPYQANAEALISVVQTDGKLVSQHAIPKLPDYNHATGVRAVSQDSRYFAVALEHENKLSHWWDSTMDMWPWGADYYLYVWRVGTRVPKARIQTSGSASASFVPEVSGIVIADGDGVNLFRLPDTSPGE